MTGSDQSVETPDYLPAQATRLIGREEEVAAVRKIARSEAVRLLTLTGPPGIGKTRLALAVASDLRSVFEDGVAFIDLSAIRDHALVVTTIGRWLGLRERPGHPLLKVVSQALGERRVLLVLDNFEQVVAAAPDIAALLAACPGLKILVTSREPLHLRWEHEFQVPPLGLPDLNALPPAEALDAFPAVMLFVERARAVQPDFALTPHNARAVAEMCVRLDGLPLAIELAAARVKLLPPEAMLSRMADRFTFLRGAARDLPARHQTLDAAIEWSYRLLPADEQDMFRRLAVFTGGFTLQAAEAVCADPAAPGRTLDLLASLMDRSLLRRDEHTDGDARFRMLETIREYAVEQLARQEDLAALRGRHAAFFLRTAEMAEPELQAPAQDLWLERLERDHDNLRAALDWTLGGADPETGVRLAIALGLFWYVRGHLGEGRMWLERALAVSEGVSTPWRARALYEAGMLARRQGDYSRATHLGTESLALYRQLGDRRGMATTLDMLVNIAWSQGRYDEAAALAEESLRLARELGESSALASSLNSVGLVARRRGEYDRAAACFRESLALFRELGDKRNVAFMLNNLGLIARYQGDFQRAAATLEEGLTLFRSLGDKDGTALLLNNLGLVARHQGDLHRAGVLSTESLALFRELADRAGVAYAQHSLGLVAHQEGDQDHAAILFHESLGLRHHLGDRRGIAECFEGISAVAYARRQRERSLKLLAAASAIREALVAPLPPVDQKEIDHRLGALRAAMKGSAFHARWEAGRAVPLDQAVQYAFDTAALAPKPFGRRGAAARHPGDPLTSRERQVAGLVADGLSNREIASRLAITEKTAATHVQNIMNKLGFDSRAQIAAWVGSRGRPDG